MVSLAPCFPLNRKPQGQVGYGYWGDTLLPGTAPISTPIAKPDLVAPGKTCLANGGLGTPTQRPPQSDYGHLKYAMDPAWAGSGTAISHYLDRLGAHIRAFGPAKGDDGSGGRKTCVKKIGHLLLRRRLHAPGLWKNQRHYRPLAQHALNSDASLVQCHE